MRYLLLPILLLSSCRQDKNTAEETKSNEPTSMRIESERPLMGTLFRIITYAKDPQEGYLAMEKSFDLAKTLAVAPPTTIQTLS